MRALVTGTCGFIGSHLSNYLKNKGFYVIAVDIKPKTQCFLNLEADEIYQLDLREWSSWQFLASRKIDRIYHLAANMGRNRIHNLSRSSNNA